MGATPSRCVLLSLLLLLPQPLVPATLTVNGQTGDDAPGICDLVEAIENANDDDDTNPHCPGVGAYGDDTIELTVDVALDTVAVTSNGANGLPVIADTLEIQGNGFAIERASGAPKFRIIKTDADLTIRNTTIAGGDTAESGGAVLVADGGELVVIDSTLSGNRARDGGAVAVDLGFIELIDSIVSDNVADGALGGGGLLLREGTLFATVDRSTVSGNVASGWSGGGITNFGLVGLAISHSTLSGNSSVDRGGALFSLSFSEPEIRHSTVADNYAANGGAGIYSDSAEAQLSDSLLANGSGGTNCAGAIDDQGGNLADDATCDTVPGTLVGLDPVLTDNGGPTPTHALLSGSNAIDLAGACAEPDQRGAEREGSCDSGAFEFLTCPDLVLAAESVTGTRMRTNCQNILVGPDFEVADNGDLTLRAGRSIHLGDGTSVDAGGALALELDPDLLLLGPERTVFVTSSTYQGDLGGLSGADDKCEARAQTAGLSGTYKAWLSGAACGPAQACRSFDQSRGIFVLVDGTVVADDWNDLVDGTLQTAISLDEFGMTATNPVWTGTGGDGKPTATADDECNDWATDNSLSNGRVGNPFATDSTWTDALSEGCSTFRALYCFEQ